MLTGKTMTLVLNTAKVLIVDDQPANLKILKQVLQRDYRLYFAKTGKSALDIAVKEKVDIILLDIMMPEMNGYDVCRALKSNPLSANIPVIFVTARAEITDEETGFDVGGVDYIVKPITPSIVKARVRTHLSLVRTETLEATQVDLIQRLGRAAEFKDNETGMHVQRMSHYSYILAKAVGFDEARAEQILRAAPMHDIGKIGIPDNILLKPGRLTKEEFECMKQHPEIGARILENPTSSLVSLAKSIALTHHEKWDGTGYPKGLRGIEIPIEGRIVAIADVFDALTSPRPYKSAWPVEDAIEHLEKMSGEQFDPELITLFLQELPKILEIKDRFLEE